MKTQALLGKMFEKQHLEDIILDLSKHTCASQPFSPQHAHCLQATQLCVGSHYAAFIISTPLMQHSAVETRQHVVGSNCRIALAAAVCMKTQRR